MITKVRIGLVDDHQIVLDGLLALLHDIEHVEIAFATTDATKVLALLQVQIIDLLVTDLMMPVLSGAALAKAVRKAFPEIKILALSMNDDGELASDMVADSEIEGYALKNISKEDLLNAIEGIANGGIYFSDEILDAMDKVSTRRKNIEAAKLTTREIEIIKLIEKEFNNKQIAEALFISERTVESHRKNIFRKTQTSSALGVVKYAYEHKLI